LQGEKRRGQLSLRGSVENPVFQNLLIFTIIKAISGFTRRAIHPKYLSTMQLTYKWLGITSLQVTNPLVRNHSRRQDSKYSRLPGFDVRFEWAKFFRDICLFLCSVSVKIIKAWMVSRNHGVLRPAAPNSSAGYFRGFRLANVGIRSGLPLPRFLSTF
jgi:hypothetical protein